MFSHLSVHNKILVTGPHRSGTTFAATAIANDTGHGLIREELCGFSQSGVEHWMATMNPVVIQAPFAANICHQFPKALVVFMHRCGSDIAASQERMFLEDGDQVFWPKFEMSVRDDYNTERFDKTVSEITYECWQEQKQRLPNHLELEYESLSSHELWVPKEQRINFHVRQTHVA